MVRPKGEKRGKKSQNELHTTQRKPEMMHNCLNSISIKKTREGGSFTKKKWIGGVQEESLVWDQRHNITEKKGEEE